MSSTASPTLAYRRAAAGRRGSIDAVAIGASAGGVQALLRLLSGFRADYRLPIIVVLHLPEDRDSQLARLFQTRTAMAVREAAAQAPINPGTLYFAGPNYHLSVEQDRTFSISCEAPVHGSRPAIDVLMSSAADAYGPGLAGILLTGASDDGAAGLTRIARCGGLTVVQEPGDAEVATMPEAALRQHQPDHILKLDAIRALLFEFDRPQEAR